MVACEISVVWPPKARNIFFLLTHAKKTTLAINYHHILAFSQCICLMLCLPALISMMSHSAPGMGSMSNADQRRAPRRPSLSSTEKGRPEYQEAKKVCLSSWGVSSVGCSFGDSQRNRGALTEANRVSKKAVKRSCAGQGILGKVRDFFVW